MPFVEFRFAGAKGRRILVNTEGINNVTESHLNATEQTFVVLASVADGENETFAVQGSYDEVIAKIKAASSAPLSPQPGTIHPHIVPPGQGSWEL